ncbi:MAG: hypothetical protein JWO38_581, partial [Gemmataceae bacterium]|nr:hypothetical protein [Gemmataceae bacterium]
MSGAVKQPDSLEHIRAWLLEDPKWA